MTAPQTEKHHVVVTGAWRDRQTQGEAERQANSGRGHCGAGKSKNTALSSESTPITERPFMSSQNSHEKKSQG